MAGNIVALKRKPLKAASEPVKIPSPVELLAQRKAQLAALSTKHAEPSQSAKRKLIQNKGISICHLKKVRAATLEEDPR